MPLCCDVNIDDTLLSVGTELKNEDAILLLYGIKICGYAGGYKRTSVRGYEGTKMRW